jgi:uncharacterized protein (DUF58 family)
MPKPAGTITVEDLVRFGNLELLARKVVEGFITGLHKSPYHGFSVEFAEHRSYNPGEPIRHIDWKLYGRTDKLFIKKFEDETNLRARLIVDVSGSMYYPFEKWESVSVNKVTYAALAAASLADLLQRQRDAVGLSLVDDRIRFHAPARSSRVHLRHLFSVLEDYVKRPPSETRYATTLPQHLHEIAESIHRRSLIILFSDLMTGIGSNLPLREALEPLFSALGHLVFCKHEVILFHVVDAATELNLSFDNRPYEFEDAETGEKLRLNPVEIQHVYQEQASRFQTLMKGECANMGVDFHQVDVRTDLQEILMTFLVRRQKMF